MFPFVLPQLKVKEVKGQIWFFNKWSKNKTSKKLEQV